MVKWIGWIVLIAGGGYVAYDTYMSGYFTRPNMPEGAFLRIQIQSGRVFRFEAGHRSDLMSATIPI